MNREILLGDEAIGLGAIHAGLSGVYGYPGTPSTEIFEFVERRTEESRRRPRLLVDQRKGRLRGGAGHELGRQARPGFA